MERVLFQEIATPEHLREHHKWARRVTAIYGILFAIGISFAMAHHYQSSTRAPTSAEHAGTSIVAITQPAR